MWTRTRTSCCHSTARTGGPNDGEVFFDAAWNKLDFTMLAPLIMEPISIPDNYLEMLMIASKLSFEFGFVRIDMYSNGENCLVGEITHCDGSGNATFSPDSGENVASKIIFN
jgi:hypothetical protein